MNIKEFYWAAGFIEGEGSFRKSSLRQSVAVSVAQVQREPLERLMANLGGNINGKEAAKYNRNASYCYTWALGGAAAVGLVMTLYPLMSPKRKAQIRQALDYWRNSLPRSQYRTHCAHGHEFTENNTRIRIRGTWKCRICKQCERIKWTKSNERQRNMNTGHYKHRAITGLTEGT